MYLGAIKITYNRANENGGGIYWQDVQPIFNGTLIVKNFAKIYGNEQASYPIRLVKFIDILDENEIVIKGGRNQDQHDLYLYHDGLAALPPIVNNGTFYQNDNFFIDSV